MQPNDVYSYDQKNRISPDWASLSQCYQPIIGLDGLGLYHYLWAHDDAGQGKYRWSQILNHLDMGMPRLIGALDRLTALQLLEMYKQEDTLCLALQSPLSRSAFLAHSLYRPLLAKKVGEAAVEQLDSPFHAKDTKYGKQFSEVFDTKGNPLVQVAPVQEGLDMEPFKRQMVRHQLRFDEEETSLIGLHHIAERQGWGWFETFQLAEQTAIRSLDGQGRLISIRRMEEAIQKELAKPSHEQHTERESKAIREAKKHRPLDFLENLKQARHAVVLYDEKVCLQDLEKLGLLDEVINMILLRAFKHEQGNLDNRYARRVGNSLSAQKIRTAEQALAYFKEFDRTKGKPQQKQADQTGKSNVPEWSKQEVNTEQTAEGQAKLAALYKELEELETKGGGA